MKNSSISSRTELISDRKSSASRCRRIAFLGALLLAAGWQSKVAAQTDNFNDGNDTSPVAWTHYDAIYALTGGASGVQDTWSFPAGNTYRLQANPSPLPGTYGPARVSSFPTNIYTDFYAAVDIVAWSNTWSQPFGLLARAGDFITTPGVPTTRGYMFIYVNGAASAPNYDNFIAIARLRNDASTAGVHGSSGTTAEVHGVNLDPTKQYRMVFIGEGTHLEGRVYQLPDVTTPIAVVSANTAGETPQHASGQCGVFAFNLANEAGTNYAGKVDVTFDNYQASTNCPSTSIADDFNDGNDTTPAPAWVRFDPIGGVTAPPAEFTFPSGGYRIVAPAPLAPDAGPARAGSVRAEAAAAFSDFYVSVDLLDWDDTTRQAFGILTRGNNFALGQTEGYLFSYELGSGTLPNTTGGDTDISIIVGENPVGLPTSPSGIHLTKGNQYRMVFVGQGTSLTGKIYDLANPSVPLLVVTANDPDATYTRGQIALISASQGGFDVHGDVTYDNFYAAPAEPRLTLDASSGTAVVSWSASLDCIWVLESSHDIGPGAVWTEVTANQVAFNGGQNVHTAATPMAGNANTFYRLRKL